MRVVFLSGPAASGKHTIGSLLSKRLGIPLFHNHLTVDLATTLFEFGSDAFVSLRARIWLTAFAEAAAAGRSFIFTFHPEATVDRRLIDELVAVIESSGGRVDFVELECDPATILQRLAAESRRKFGKLTDPDLYLQIDEQGGFAFPPLPAPVAVIDTGSLTAEEAAIAIADALARRT